MKKTLVVLVVVFLAVCVMGNVEASIGQSLGNGWKFLTAPVNCLANLVADVVTVGTKFVVCVLGNLNPANIIP